MSNNAFETFVNRVVAEFCARYGVSDAATARRIVRLVLDRPDPGCAVRFAPMPGMVHRSGVVAGYVRHVSVGGRA